MYGLLAALINFAGVLNFKKRKTTCRDKIVQVQKKDSSLVQVK